MERASVKFANARGVDMRDLGKVQVLVEIDIDGQHGSGRGRARERTQRGNRSQASKRAAKNKHGKSPDFSEAKGHGAGF